MAVTRLFMNCVFMGTACVCKSMVREDSLMIQFGESHIIYGFAEKQSPCVPLFVIIVLQINRLWEWGKEFINFAASSLITSL